MYERCSKIQTTIARSCVEDTFFHGGPRHGDASEHDPWRTRKPATSAECRLACFLTSYRPLVLRSTLPSRNRPYVSLSPEMSQHKMFLHEGWPDSPFRADGVLWILFWRCISYMRNIRSKFEPIVTYGLEKLDDGMKALGNHSQPREFYRC